jgi:hypothetical protein
MCRRGIGAPAANSVSTARHILPQDPRARKQTGTAAANFH